MTGQRGTRAKILAALGLALAATLTLATGCGTQGSQQTSGTATTQSTPDTIVIKNFMFAPMAIEVKPGAKVTVRNEDTATHTLTASNKMFDTGNITPGQTKTFTAPTKPGDYSYICDIHQYMQGDLKVS